MRGWRASFAKLNGFGGVLRLGASIALEIVFSTLMAPIRMVVSQ
jgi:membrane glycosyltransferase